MAEPRSLAKALRLARVASGLSQVAAAKHIRRTRQQLSTYEREVSKGGVPPSDDILELLADLYGTTVQALKAGQAAEGPATRPADPAPVRRRIFALLNASDGPTLNADQQHAAFEFMQAAADAVAQGPDVASTLARQLEAVDGAWERLRPFRTPTAQAPMLEPMAEQPKRNKEK